MATIDESARKLLEPDSYPLIRLLHFLVNVRDDRRRPAKALLQYTIITYPNPLIRKLFETIQRSSSSSSTSITRILCYDLLHQILPTIWINLWYTTRIEVKIHLSSMIWLETDYEILKACCSCVSRLASFLLPRNEWGNLLHLMFHYLSSSNSWYRTMAALFLCEDLIQKCPEVFIGYVDRLIKRFKYIMLAVSDDHRCGVVAAKVSLKLIMYLSTPASYSKFYELIGHVTMTLFVAICEDDLVCGLLEELIVLAGVKTAFLKDVIGDVVDSMVKLAENLGLGERSRQLAIEFVVTVAEDRDSGLEVMQNVPNELVTKLLLVLIDMLVYIVDNPSWGKAISDDEDEGELSMCSYGKECLNRIAVALGGNVIVPNMPSSLFDLLAHKDWQIRHAAVTAIGVVSRGCSNVIVISSKDMLHLVEAIVKLIRDKHPRVQWAAMHTIDQVSMYLSPQFQNHYHQLVLPALIQVLDDFENPRLQTRATSTILVFSVMGSADIMRLYLHSIVSKLVVFLQRGMKMLKEEAMATLASLATPSKEDAAYIYDSIMPYLKVIMVTATDDASRKLLAKTLECITKITKAVGNRTYVDYLDKVIATLISLQNTHMEEGDPMRCLLLQIWGTLCETLGTDFIPYLSLAMPIVLNSATLENYLSVPDSSDDSDDESEIYVTAGNKIIGIRSHLLEQKAVACDILCFFASKLKEGLHLWVNEVVTALVPNLTFEFTEEVKTAAISAMPLLLNSAACAMKKGLPVTGCGKFPVQTISDTVIPALLDALKKESTVQIQARLIEAFNECIQIPGSNLSKDQAAEFVDGISIVLSTFSYHKTEKEKRHNEQEAEQHLTICRNIGICLGTMVKKLKASFLPLFDMFLPYVSLMWSDDRTAEERRIVVHLFRDIAEQCRHEVFRYYEEWIPLLPRLYYDKNPDVPQIVATAIGICAEFGADSLMPHTTEIFCHLKTVMEGPEATNPENIMAYEAAVSTCGKLNMFVFESMYNYKFILLWLKHLPIRFNRDEAKISHELLCSMVETPEQIVAGPGGSYIPFIIDIFAEVLWSGYNLATEETTRRMIKQLKRFQRELQPNILSMILETLPLEHQNMLRDVLFLV